MVSEWEFMQSSPYKRDTQVDGPSHSATKMSVSKVFAILSISMSDQDEALYSHFNAKSSFQIAQYCPSDS